MNALAEKKNVPTVSSNVKKHGMLHYMKPYMCNIWIAFILSTPKLGAFRRVAKTVFVTS